MGVFYRNDAFQLSEDENFYFGRTFYVPWFGVRSVIQTPIVANNELYLRACVDGGYSPKYESTFASFGLSIVFDTGVRRGEEYSLHFGSGNLFKRGGCSLIK